MRLRISALWVAVMFVFAYVDLFSLYRPDFRADLETNTVGGFEVSQAFLVGITLYVIVPSLMIYLSLVLPRVANRSANMVTASLYALTIVGAAVGEWTYFIVGSALEASLLGVIVHHAWTWRLDAGTRPSPPNLR